MNNGAARFLIMFNTVKKYTKISTLVRKSIRGNIFAMLFAAVGMTGVGVWSCDNDNKGNAEEYYGYGFDDKCAYFNFKCEHVAFFR